MFSKNHYRLFFLGIEKRGSFKSRYFGVLAEMYNYKPQIFENSS